MAWGKSTKQKKAMERRKRMQWLIKENCPERFIEFLKTPPSQLPRLTKKEREWAEGVAAKFEKEFTK